MADDELNNDGLEQLMQSIVSESTDPPVEPPVDSPISDPPIETTEQPIESEPASTTVRDALKAQGYAVDEFADDDSLIQYMSEGWDRAQHAPDPKELERLRKIEAEYIRSQRETTEPARPAEKQVETPPVSKWSPPPLSERAAKMMEDGLVSRCEDGNLGVFNQVTKTFEYDARYDRELTEIADHVAWQAKASKRLATDPIGALKEAGLLDVIKQELGLDKIDERAAEKIRAEIRQENESKAIEAYWEQHRTEYLELDDKGQVKTILNNGQKVPVPNARGQVYLDIMEELSAAGVPEYKAHERAVALSSKFAPAKPTETAAEKVEVAANKKKAFLAKTREQGTNGHKPVNRVFPDLATAAAREDDSPRRLEDVLRNALMVDE